MDFNKERFIHFAQYDLVINKTFYRNFALFISISLIGGTVLAFMGRYLLWTSSGVNAMPGSRESAPKEPPVRSVASFS